MNVWQLARLGDVKKFKGLAKSKSPEELNATDRFGFTCFHWCVPPPSFFRSSFSFFCFPDDKNDNHHRAAQKGEDGIVAVLIKRGADFDAVDGDMQTPLVGRFTCTHPDAASKLFFSYSTGPSTKCTRRSRACSSRMEQRSTSRTNSDIQVQRPSVLADALLSHPICSATQGSSPWSTRHCGTPAQVRSKSQSPES